MAKQREYIIDAKNKALGRVASQAALILQGKRYINYDPARKSGARVKIVNAAKINFTGKKLRKTVIRWHTGYIGGLKEIALGHLWKTSPDFVIRRAVSGMLPKNKLRSKRLKNLRVEM